MHLEDVKRLLTELSAASGVSGFEYEPAAIAGRYLAPYVTTVERDNSGNLIAFKQGEHGGGAFSLAFAAHMDEIGLMVTSMEKGGFIRFTAVGGIDPRTLLGQAVVVHGRHNFPGVIGARAPHLLTAKERNKEIKMEYLYIDLGLPEDEVRKMVQVGDIVSLHRPALEMAAGNCLAGKSLDDRAGVAALVLCAAELQRIKHEVDIYFVATVQEEVGVRGATVAAYNLVPDLAVAVDVCHGDMPGLSTGEGFEPGGGPAVAIGPNCHPHLSSRLQNLAQENRLPYHPEPVAGPTGTDARAFQISRDGIPAALLSIPLRYMHSSVELINLDDLVLTARLMALFAGSLDRAFVEGLKCI